MKDFLSRLVAPVLVAFLAAGMAQGAFYQWSRTAASNGIADPSVNWAEGMSPSSVNDSARAMMARLAEWRDDTSGLLTTAGTSTAYTVSTFEGLTTVPADGTTLTVTFHATNGTSATLTADGGTTYAIDTQPSTAVTAGVLISGRSYRLRFSLSNTAWMVQGSTGDTIPVGTVSAYIATTAPTNWHQADGSCVSRTTFASLFAVIGTNYGGCDGSTTFGLPDLRARSIVGYDAGNSTGRNGSALTLQNTGGASSHVQTESEMAQHTHFASSSSVVSDPGHQHQEDGANGTIQNTGTTGGTGNVGIKNTVTDIGFTGISVATSTTLSYTGGSAAMSLMNPFQVLNYIIKVQ